MSLSNSSFGYNHFRTENIFPVFSAEKAFSKQLVALFKDPKHAFHRISFRLLHSQIKMFSFARLQNIKIAL